MADYRRFLIPGGTYFFTVVTAKRRPWLSRHSARKILAGVMREVRSEFPFETVGLVVLPDHLHAVWRLPDGDSDFRGRWHRIKQRTTLRLRAVGGLTGRLWQPRFWEHAIRDEDDLRRHLDYIHYNPVKHGFVASPRDWGPSSFHRYVTAGVYAADWAGPDVEFEMPE